MTRAYLLAAILIAAPFVLPPATAKEALLTDAKDDQVVHLHTDVGPSVGSPVALPAFQGGDLLQLDVLEDDDQFAFRTHVASLGQPVSLTAHFVSFVFGDVNYIVYTWFNNLAGANTGAELGVWEDDRGYQTISRLTPEVDVGAGTFTVAVPRAYLLDQRGRMPLMGDVFEDVYVQTDMYLYFLAVDLESRDRMPEDGGVMYTVERGGARAGHIRLAALDPVRTSNGGATTFVYHLELDNAGDADDSVALAVLEAPADWKVSVEPVVNVPAKAKKEFVTIVTVPFGHEHGGFSKLELQATSARDPTAKAVATLGVLHTPIPQPAGHHSELYLHTAPANSGVFQDLFPFYTTSMNTDADHAADGLSAPPNYFGEERPQMGWAWAVDLAPGLQMGLDFDVNKTGTLHGALLGKVAKGDASIAVRLLLLPRTGGAVVLAESPATPVVVDAQAPTPFELTLTPTAAADLVPYVSGQNLRLLLLVTPPATSVPCCPTPHGVPQLLVEAFKLSLPLNEYSDPVSVSKEIAGALELVAQGPVDRRGKPGALLAYAFTLANRGEAAESFTLDLAGTDAPRGEIAPGNLVKLGPGETALVTLGVRIPPDATDGQVLEVLVVARAQRDPTLTAIGRTKSTVTLDATDALDETEIFAAAKDAGNDAPGLGAVGAVLAAAGAAFALRRRKA